MKNKKGFTLVELLAVIAILALLVLLALPNVLSMFNKAKKDIFLTEAKNIYKEVSKKYISETMKGNKLTRVSSNSVKLDLESNNLEYDVILDKDGSINYFQVSNDTFCLSGSFSNLSELTIDKITDGSCSFDYFVETAGTLRNDYLDVAGFNSKYYIKSLSFYSDNRVIDNANVYDVSVEKDNSIKLYVKTNENDSKLSDLFVVADGKIGFPKDSSNLLAIGEPNNYGTAISQLTEMNFNDSVVTNNVINMFGMFQYTIELSNLDLSSFDTRNVTNMSYMFYNNGSTITGLNKFNTSKVTDMSYMFYFQRSTSLLDLSSFNTSKVTNMESMFDRSNPISIDLSSFDTSNVTNMSYMFSSSKAKTLDLSSFDTSKVTDMSRMFYYASAETLDLSNFDTSNVTKMHYMFYNNQATTLNLSNFNTSKVTDMSRMFDSSKAKSLDLSSFDTSKVTDMSLMFQSTAATSINLSSFDTSSVTTMSQMFYDSSASTLDLSSFNTSKVTDMYSMFRKSKATSIVGFNKFNTSNVTNMNSMFQESNVKVIDLSSFNTIKVEGMGNMFSDSKAEIIDLSNFDTSNVTNMNFMFFRVLNLKTIYASDKFNTSAAAPVYDMFSVCNNLVGGEGTVFNSSKDDEEYARIDKGTSSPGYFTLKK